MNHNFLNDIIASNETFTISTDQSTSGMITYIGAKDYFPLQQIVLSEGLKATNIPPNIQLLNYNKPLSQSTNKIIKASPLATRLIYQNYENKETKTCPEYINNKSTLDDKDLLTVALFSLNINRDKLKDSKAYYNEEDKILIENYYQSIDFESLDPAQLFFNLHQLINNTHSNQFSYKESRLNHLYPWVDLQPNGELKSIYSSKSMNAEEIIFEDLEIEEKKNKAYTIFFEKKLS